MLGMDVLNSKTGEVLRTFDVPWFDQGKRYIKGWIKAHGYEFERVEFPKNNNGIVWVKEVEK